MEVRIDNSDSKVLNLSDEDFKLLRKELSYRLDPQAARFIPNPALHIKYLIDKKGNFPTGLLHRVMAFAKARGLAVTYNDLRSQEPCPKVLSRAFKPGMTKLPYKAQLEALRAVTDVMRGVLQLPTGCGKSFIVAMILVKLQLRTLIVVPTLELKRQLTEDLTDTLTTMEGVTVENIDSGKLNTLTNYDCIIWDEVHHAAAKTYRNHNKKAWSKIRYRYGMTATPFRNKSEEQMLYESVAGQVIYSLSYTEAIKNKYIVPVEAYYVKVPTMTVEGYNWAEVYKELITDRKDRNDSIVEIAKNLILNNKATLVIVKEIKHGQFLSDLIGCPFVCGEDPDSKKYLKEFSLGKIPCIVGTSGTVGEGCDTKACEFVILATTGKAKTTFMQQIGRGVRKWKNKDSMKLILIKDFSHKWLKNHFNAQKKILKEEYGVELISL